MGAEYDIAMSLTIILTINPKVGYTYIIYASCRKFSTASIRLKEMICSAGSLIFGPILTQQ